MNFAEVLNGHPRERVTYILVFDFPTTGELAGDTYYYIANAQLRRFSQDGSILDFDQLNDVYIFKTILTPTPKME